MKKKILGGSSMGEKEVLEGNAINRMSQAGNAKIFAENDEHVDITEA